MIIALDYDKTFTADPKFWSEFILNVWRADHTVFICTMRLETSRSFNEIKDELIKYLGCFDAIKVPIIFSNHGWKKQAALDNGFEVDIWIDDAPHWIAPPSTLKDIEDFCYANNFTINGKP